MQSMNESDPEARRLPMLDTPPIVFVVDDDGSVRNSLELLINSAGWRAQTFASAQEFLSCPRAPGPSCLVLDVTLPDLNGLELQKRVAVDRSDMPIIFISGYGDVPMTVQAMKAGAVEFLTKPLRGDELLSAIQYAIERSSAALGHRESMRMLRQCYASLTARERDVMGLVASGLLNKQVGSELGISEITVKAHRGQVMRKMQACSLADLVNIAAELGIATARKAKFNCLPNYAPEKRYVGLNGYHLGHSFFNDARRPGFEADL
jgi:FixJ family two-component response regulator